MLYRLVMEPFEFVSQMQNAALEVSYHQVIRRRTGQSLSGLLFESFVPPFKISNMIRFRHGSLSKLCINSKEQSGRATGGRGTAWVLPQTLPEDVRSLVEKPKPLKQLASPNFGIPKWKWTDVIDLNQTGLLSLLREGVRRQGKPAIAAPSLENCRRRSTP